MRAVVVTRNGGSEVLELADRPSPEAGAGQLLVDVAVAGVNYRDIYERRGGYGAPPPLVAGIEGAGTVAAAGEGVAEFAPGDRVAWSSAQGSYAEQAVVEAAKAVPVPDAVDDETACGALLQGMTAHYLCTSVYPVKEGDEVLVHAAAGGVGLLLTQMVKMRGGRVTGTTSSEEKAELARAAGADEVVRYEDVPEGRFAVVYDGVAAATFERSLAALAPRGLLALYGSASGPVPPLDLGRLAPGSLYVTRPSLMQYTATREELLVRATDVFGWIVEGLLDVRIGRRYALEQAREAQEDLEGRRTTGKVLLLVR